MKKANIHNKISKNTYKKLIIAGIIVLLVISLLITFVRTTTTSYTFSVMYQSGNINGVTSVLVSQGKKITFLITSDSPKTFQVLGYAINVPVTREKVTKVEFSADQAGHFSYGFDGENGQLGVLDVLPK